jgi:hypothetical protein
LRTSLTQRPGRLETYTGQALALAVLLVVITLLTLTIGVASSLSVSLLDGKAVSWPPATQFVKGMGAMMLVSGAWASFRIAFGVLFRGADLAIGVALMWITLEVLFEIVALQAGGVLQAIYKVLPAANTVATTSAFGSSGSPIANPDIAPWVIAAYAAIFVVFGAVLLLKRDVA